MANPDDVPILAERLSASNCEGHWRTLIGELAAGEAVILSQSDHPTDTPTVFRLAERLNCSRTAAKHTQIGVAPEADRIALGLTVA
jgi:hypothetical protein